MGPVISIPMDYRYKTEEGYTEFTHYWHVLPEDLVIDGEITPKELKRGIYELAVYTSNLKVSGSFQIPAPPSSEHLHAIRYDESIITLGISDLRGIQNEIEFGWNGEQLKVEPGSKFSKLAYSGLHIPLNLEQAQLTQQHKFSFQLDLQGSEQLSFIPIGASTSVKLHSSWTDPSFKGAFLPDTREVNEKGFEASWKVLQLNRNFPQAWRGEEQFDKIKASSFGVGLLFSMDDYQKSTRSSKYGAMTIALTFLIFFLVEVVNKIKIHPFQYALVGLALCLFYILQLAISEHLGFNLAYCISTLAIVGMIGSYALSIFKVKRIVILLSLALLAIYGFLFVTLQMADYALLMGAVGLCLILAATMYFTRNINWYAIKEDQDDE